MKELENIINYIESKRESMKISKKDFCSKLDITPQYYHLLTTGKSIPNAETLAKMAVLVGYRLVLSPLNM